jgi:hypothetical protein
MPVSLILMMEAVRTSETSVYSNNTSQKTLNFILAAARTGNLTLLLKIYKYKYFYIVIALKRFLSA